MEPDQQMAMQSKSQVAGAKAGVYDLGPRVRRFRPVFGWPPFKDFGQCLFSAIEKLGRPTLVQPSIEAIREEAALSGEAPRPLRREAL
jgi:hypothetical protein